ncbi:hypothetical protein C7974DRAFT_286440, partial [Boeremia exigua]|uniref:uncharacterized protein n=1 Tax=Boeremia exigua TaxID=749465 RepID=UPI001E8ECF8A
NTTNSPLLRLPGELRNRIYELVLGGNVFPMTHLDLPRQPVNYRIFGFLLVCRHIHREARWTVFETNTFTFAFPPERLRHYETIYDSLSPRAKASIRCIRI